MFNNKLIVIAALAIAFGVHAQSTDSTTPTTTGSAASSEPTDAADQCLLACLQIPVNQGICSSVEDLTCICSNTDFQNIFSQCVFSQCPDDVALAASHEQSECGGTAFITASGSVSGSASAATSVSTSNSASTSVTGSSSGLGSASTSHPSNTAPSSSVSGSSKSSGSSSPSASSNSASSVGFGVSPIVAAGVSLLGAIASAAVVF